MTQAEIAEAANVSLAKVKADTRRGKLDKSDPESVDDYIMAMTGQIPSDQPKQPAESATDESILPNSPSVEPSSTSSEPVDLSEYVDTRTISSDKGYEGSIEHLLSLPVGTIYKGFKHITVEICADEEGSKFIKQYPACPPFAPRS